MAVQTEENKQQTFPPQHQANQPGIESRMNPRPSFEDQAYKPAGKLLGKGALITGGDSGIGRAVAVAYAKEGADIVIAFLNEQADADETKRQVEAEGRKCFLFAGDIGNEEACRQLADFTIKQLGRLDILVNNAGEQHPVTTLESITAQQLEKTFRTNVFSFFYLTKAVLPHLKPGSAIINTASITAYEGSKDLIDYSATKGAIVTFTRSLSQQLIGRGIRVNGVAPGPIWTPLIPSTFDEQKVSQFGADTPMQRAGQPQELAPSYVFLASGDSSYMAGQILHVNGGVIVNG